VKARTRHLLSIVSSLYLITVGVLFTHVPLRTFNLLLATCVVPMVWLLARLAVWLVYRDAKRWARDIEKVNASRERRAQQVSAR
jgi:hypothetical protein